MLRRIMIFLTSILLLLNSALVNATTINGWFLSNPNAVGASILYDATKGSLTSSVLISPNASQVAKVLRGGVAGIALSFAVEQLLGAVDWVLDPANNEIVYKDKENVSGVFKIGYMEGKTFKGSLNEACLIAVQEYIPTTTVKKIEFDPKYNSYSCYYQITPSGLYAVLYVVSTQEVKRRLPLITAAQQVIENAESDNLDAQFAVLAAAINILSEAEQDDAKAKPIADELENNSKCPSGIVRNGSCWVCDKSLFMPYTRATRDAKTATRGKSCKNVTDTTVKAANATLFRNLINARVQENACWSPPDQNHATALVDAQNALILCEN